MGISSFKAPVAVHVRAILFMGWVLLFVAQVLLGATGSLALHRKLGWLAVGWPLAMVIVGTLSTIWIAQKAAVSFFFLPAQFVLMNPLSMILFVALLIGAAVKRRDREWHPRLFICGMAAIMGPSFGRLLPAPLFMYSMLTAAFIGMIAFPVAGIVRDKLRYGRVHPAWWFGLVRSCYCNRQSRRWAEVQLQVQSTRAQWWERPARVFPASAINGRRFQ